jgi:hypothetical protein
MKTKIFGMLLLAGALSLTACDEFLTETPKHSLTTDNSVLNYSGAKNAVNGIYGVYEKYGSNLGGSLYSNLHCMAGFWTYNNEMFNMGYKQSSSSVEGYWTQLYKIINACNAAVNGINKLSDGAFPSLAEKNALLGEARCFRGYCNLELLWLFGRWFDKADSPYGILYRDQTSELSNLMVGRISVGESYRLILEDLEFAEQNALVYGAQRRELHLVPIGHIVVPCWMFGIVALLASKIDAYAAGFLACEITLGCECTVIAISKFSYSTLHVCIPYAFRGAGNIGVGRWLFFSTVRVAACHGQIAPCSVSHEDIVYLLGLVECEECIVVVDMTHEVYSGVVGAGGPYAIAHRVERCLVASPCERAHGAITIAESALELIA